MFPSFPIGCNEEAQNDQIMLKENSLKYNLGFLP
jgi:hypothetical protein